jgi:arginyl-tRNA synthetase
MTNFEYIVKNKKYKIKGFRKKILIIKLDIDKGIETKKEIEKWLSQETYDDLIKVELELIKMWFNQGYVMLYRVNEGNLILKHKDNTYGYVSSDIATSYFKKHEKYDFELILKGNDLL